MVVAGDDVIEYDVAPKPDVHEMGMLVPDIAPSTKLVGLADVYISPDVTGDEKAPMKLPEVMVNVYSDTAARPVNVYGTVDVVCVVVTGVDTIEYDVAPDPGVHESEILGFDVDPVWTINETGPAGGADVYEIFLLDAP